MTVRIRVTAHYGGSTGDVSGEQRRAFAVVRDPSLLPGFPVALGVRNDSDPYPSAGGESSAKLADIDGDGKLEIIYADDDGLLHAFNEDGSEVPGYPVQLGYLRGFDPADPANYLNAPAYASGAIPTDDFGSSVPSGPAVGDLDGDGTLDIVVATAGGDVFAFHAADGTPMAGWPVGLPQVHSSDTSPDHIIARGAFASPTLYDLDGDGKLEVIEPAFDGYLYVFRYDGTPQAGFPVKIVAPQLWTNPSMAQPGRLLTPAAVGDADGDGVPEIAIGSDETGSDAQTGAVHLVHGDGNNHPGGPEVANWPVRIDSLDLLPLVGLGVTSPVAMADVNGDGRPDLALAGAAARILIADADQPPRDPGMDLSTILIPDSSRRGPLSDVTDPIDKPLLNAFTAPSFGDLDADGQPDFITGGAGLRLAANLSGGWSRQPFTHQLGVWNTMTGKMLPGFPQRMEDYMFFVNPSVADVNGDGYPEVIAGSGGYYVHAWDACGREADGWPKFDGRLGDRVGGPGRHRR